MIFYYHLFIGEVRTIRNETTYSIHGKYPLNRKSSNVGYRWSSAVVESDPTLAKCLFFIRINAAGKILRGQKDFERKDRLPVRPVYVKRAILITE